MSSSTTTPGDPSLIPPFLSALAARRSIYALTPTSPIPDARIRELLARTLKLVPSSFNLQTTRIVLLLRGAHRRFWGMAEEEVAAALRAEGDGEERVERYRKRLEGFAGAYGSVLFFEARSVYTEAAEKNPAYSHLFEQWADHTDGMHTLAVWAMLEAEGLGANLQHYNFNPGVARRATELFGLPGDWELKSQLVFGGWDGQRPAEKEKRETEEVLKVFEE